MEPTKDLAPVELIRIVLRHKTKAFFIMAGILALTAAIIILKPKHYVSESKLFVEFGRETVGLDPTATMGQTATVVARLDHEINSIVALLTSRDTIGGVVDSLGPEAILGESGGPGIMSGVSRMITGLLGRSSEDDVSATPRDRAIEAVANLVTVEAERDSSVINVRCQANKPKLAQDVARSVVSVYRDLHMRMHRMTGSEKFFASQKALLMDKAADAKERLLQLKNTSGYASIEAQQSQLETQKALLAKQLLETDRLLVVTNARCEAFRKAISGLDETILDSRIEGRPNAAADGMRQQLYTLQIRERELLEKYEPDHPLVKSIQSQIEGLSNVQRQESDASRVEARRIINPNRQNLELKLLQEEAELAAYKVEKEKLQQQQEEVMASLISLNKQSINVDALTRESQMLEETYEKYARSYELARIDSALSSEKITNVNVAQQATKPLKPAGPSAATLGLLGLVTALLGGLSIPLIAEFFRHTVDSPDELEALDIPVLMVIPRSRRQRINV